MAHAPVPRQRAPVKPSKSRRPAPTAALPIDLTTLPSLDRAQLSALWLDAFGRPLEPGLRREVAIPCLAYRLQERVYGGLSDKTLRHLKAISAVVPKGRKDRPALRIPALRLRLKAGTRLLRTWHGKSHTVTVERDGFEWNGKRYASLSVIASTIAGVHWSGPAFFGLNRLTVDLKETAKSEGGRG